jgi:hypothetical protein
VTPLFSDSRGANSKGRPGELALHTKFTEDIEFTKKRERKQKREMEL